MNFRRFRRAGLLAAAFTLGVVLAQSFWNWLSWFAAVQFLFWPYLIPVACLGLLAAGSAARKWRAWFWSVSAALAVVFVSPWVNDVIANKAAPARTSELKFIAFNWLGDNPRVDDVFPWLAAQHADIVSIEEAARPDLKERLFALFPYHASSGDVVLLSRYPMREIGHQDSQGHAIVWARIAAPGQELKVYVLHAPTLRSERQLAERNAYLRDAGDLLRRETGGNVVAMGDFNTVRWDPVFWRFASLGRLHELPQIFPDLTRLAVRRNLRTIGSPIDHILAGRSLRILHCETGPALGSDHLPLICNLASPGALSSFALDQAPV
jgi:endonuclease/exonuclease/phosphatase (EEP) superfamily protein YafD